MQPIKDILYNYWGYESFRPQQQEIITSVLNGNDTLAVLPTGAGKSICYQVPALANEGICLVISPLIALMKDQVDNLRKKGIPALAIYSGMQRNDIVRTLENARSEYFKFLYLSPERLETSLFKEYLPALNVNLIAVDEAHCISQWGYDFRPSYLKIPELRKELPEVPVLAVTASATEFVRQDICTKLLMKQPNTFRQSFERKNLSYSVFQVDTKVNKLISIVKRVAGSGIIYCKSRKRTKEISDLLQMHGISASNYHAGLGSEERTKRQKTWIDNQARVIVCTNAFGMGIDKPDVRFVIHADPPDSLENYYQEAGRAGRDGKKAYAVLLYDHQDVKELSELHLSRYPSFDKIKEVYHALVNYLQIPINTGEDQRFNFHFDPFTRNFKLDSQVTLYSLKALEQDGWLEFNEKNLAPSSIVFTTTKQLLYEFYKAHPEYEETATTLLRTYDGIFDFPSFISETYISQILKQPITDVKRQLLYLHSMRIISYTPQNDAPQIVFRKNRVAASDLKMDLKSYENRKQRFVGRVNTMIEYLETDSCRSRFICNYFGDNTSAECGICDVCLEKKKTNLTKEEFETIAREIRSQLQQKNMTAEDLLLQLKNITREKTWKVLQFLQSEKQIAADKTGLLSLRATNS